MADHIYFKSVMKIKSENDRTPLQLPELNIKMEFDSENDFLHYNAETNHEEHVNNESETEKFKMNFIDQVKKTLKGKNKTEKTTNVEAETQISCHGEDMIELSSESTDDNGFIAESMALTPGEKCDLQKAYILQTCLSLLDSSSSDDDELMLLWLLCRNRKKKLRKRRR